jgi:Ca2+-binding RTX toxin-like protein
VADTTRVLGQEGDDVVNVGTTAPTTGGTVHGVQARLDVLGGGGSDDRIYVDDTGDDTANAMHSTQGRLTGLGLSDPGITYDTSNELLDVSLGGGADVANVRGTSIATVVHGRGGDERYYVSSDAELAPATTTDHLLGTLDDIDGALTVDAGAGDHTLMVSDEDATAGDGSSAERAILDEDSVTGFSTGSITYQATGTFKGGITVWTGAGDDVVGLDGARLDSSARTITTLNTNDGADDVLAALEGGADGFTDINLEEGDDTLDASGHSLPLVVFGGLGADGVTTGTGADTVIGDVGRVGYRSGGVDVTVLGGGGPGDKTDGVERAVGRIRSDGVAGGADTIATAAGDDVVIGGAAGDTIDAGDGGNVVLGDHGYVDGPVVQSTDPEDGGADGITAGSGADVAFGGTDADSITAGGGDDVVLGGHGARDGSVSDARLRNRSLYEVTAAADGGDTLTTGAGHDWIMGQQGDDTVDAGADDDTVIGGHNVEGGLDGADGIAGGAGLDTILGDNGLAARGATTKLHDVATTSAAPVTGTYGTDVIDGGGDDDALFGQSGGDRVFGGAAHDSLEGNDGDDCLAGGDGQDNIVGGGSATNGSITPARTGGALLDGADTIHGDGGLPDASCVVLAATAGGADVIAGDNARVLWVMAGGARTTNTFDGAFARTVALFDPETPANQASLVDVHGADTIQSGAGNDLAFGQGDGDTLGGGDAHDHLEGGPGADTIGGGAGQDDIVGGSSTGSGVFRSGSAPTGRADGADAIHGDDDADVVLADNGSITRSLTGGGAWETFRDPADSPEPVLAAIVIRRTTVGTTADGAGTFGNDVVHGGAGADELIGQQGDDALHGGDGSDALVGDLGKITTTLETGNNASTPRANAPFMSTPVRQAGTLFRQVQLFAFGDGNGVLGADVLLGGAGSDAVHGGAGADLINGNTDDDFLFGGSGGDAMWGGPGNDDEFGGYGKDHLDVVPRPTDPASWHTHGSVDHLQGFDLLYGGYDQDAMQADFQENGPGIADRLVDWAGTYNAYMVCNGGGAGTIIRSLDPSTILYLQDVAQGRGAFQVKSPASSSGFNETGIVFNADVKHNTKPAHPDGRGAGVCPP